MTYIHGCHILWPSSNLVHALPLLVANSCNLNMQHKIRSRSNFVQFQCPQPSEFDPRSIALWSTELGPLCHRCNMCTISYLHEFFWLLVHFSLVNLQKQSKRQQRKVGCQEEWSSSKRPELAASVLALRGTPVTKPMLYLCDNQALLKAVGEGGKATLVGARR